MAGWHQVVPVGTKDEEADAARPLPLTGPFVDKVQMALRDLTWFCIGCHLQFIPFSSPESQLERVSDSQMPHLGTVMAGLLSTEESSR